MLSKLDKTAVVVASTVQQPSFWVLSQLIPGCSSSRGSFSSTGMPIGPVILSLAKWISRWKVFKMYLREVRLETSAFPLHGLFTLCTAEVNENCRCAGKWCQEVFKKLTSYPSLKCQLKKKVQHFLKRLKYFLAGRCETKNVQSVARLTSLLFTLLNYAKTLLHFCLKLRLETLAMNQRDV